MSQLERLAQSAAARTSPLVNLLVEDIENPDSYLDRRVGFTLQVDYEHASIMINDKWREQVLGIPMNGYLLAATFDPQNYAGTALSDQRVVIMRVTGKAPIETDQEHIRAITQYYQENPDASSGNMDGLEVLSREQIQWSGLRARILGTFFVFADDSSFTLQLGTDIEDFFAAKQLVVFKPGPRSLEMLVNFVDPRRKVKAQEEAERLGHGSPVPFEIGHVRFTSTQHLARGAGEEKVPVRISPVDFLARRTGVFGMTRTGKSNTTKTMISEVAITAFETGRPIGQLVFDINGEYSNANNQDGDSSINTVFHDNTVRYRVMDTPGFLDLRSNFYEDMKLAIEAIAAGYEAKRLTGSSDDIKTFLSLDMTPPDDPRDFALVNRYKRKVSLFRAILKSAGYPPDSTNSAEQTLDISQDVLVSIYEKNERLEPGDQFSFEEATTKDSKLASVEKFFSMRSLKAARTMSLDELVYFFKAVRKIEYASGGYQNELDGIQGKNGAWLNNEERAMLSILVGRSGRADTPIVAGNSLYTAAKEFHGISGSSTISQDIYGLLEAGRIVILDLSVGSPDIRETLSRRVASGIFHTSSDRFNQGVSPPQVVIYVEEAHNLIGKEQKLTETWPRLAKEGAKYNIALVYATQEPSSVHPNILANTENFFVTHLNNDDEIRTISKFSDFADFGVGLKRSQDVGFARIKTLSANFVTPTQIKEFQPTEVYRRYESIKETGRSGWFIPWNGGTR